MVKHYLITGLRRSLRSLSVSFLNLFGLSVGIACVMLIFLLVSHELAFDDFVTQKEKVFRVIQKRTTDQGVNYSAFTPGALGPNIKENFFEIENAARLIIARESLFRANGNEFYEDNGFYAEPDFFRIFPLSFLEGDPASALTKPNQIVITEKLAKKYFGPNWKNENLLDKSFVINGRSEFQISGIIKDPPDNFHLQFDYINSFETVKNFLSSHDLEYWGTFFFYTYIKVRDNIDLDNLQTKLEDQVSKKTDPITEPLNFSISFILQPLQKIHLYSANFRNDIAIRSDIDQIIIFISIGIAILALACLNFINLTTAFATKRITEIGIRKVNGAGRKTLIFQFLGETFFLTIISFVVGAFLLELSLPLFNYSFEKSLSFSLTDNWQTPLFFSLSLIVVAFLAGLYPAFYQSGFQISRAFQGSHKKPKQGINRLREGLVMFQFVITILLLVFSLIIHRQVDFMQSKDPGFDINQVMVVPIRSQKFLRNIQTVKNEVKKIPGVIDAGATSGTPGLSVFGDDIYVPYEDINLSVRMMFIDEDFIPTMNIKLISGRNFNARDQDLQTSFIINETAARKLGWDNLEAIGKKLEWDVWVEGDTIKSGEIIGVVKDFNYRGFRDEIEPVILHYFPNQFSSLAIKINTGRTNETISSIGKTIRKWNNDLPLNYHFLDKDYERFYRSENKFGLIVFLFTFLAIIIACLGLLGLSIFITNQQLKAVGIRKVFGATSFQIFVFLNRFYLRLTVIASLIGLPISFIVIRSWLMNYVYRITPGIWPFVLVFIIMIVISIVTIGVQAFKTSIVNPVSILRNE